MKVEAYVASWIEITAAVNAANQASSRGLRSLVDWNGFAKRGMIPYGVEAYVASWIEILSRLLHSELKSVEAYVASWIEITQEKYSLLKKVVEAYVASWIEIEWQSGVKAKFKVEAYVASWIEIPFVPIIEYYAQSRGLRSLVDWNANVNCSRMLTLSRLT